MFTLVSKNSQTSKDATRLLTEEIRKPPKTHRHRAPWSEPAETMNSDLEGVQILEHQKQATK